MMGTEGRGKVGETQDKGAVWISQEGLWEVREVEFGDLLVYG